VSLSRFALKGMIDTIDAALDNKKARTRTLRRDGLFVVLA